MLTQPPNDPLLYYTSPSIMPVKKALMIPVPGPRANTSANCATKAAIDAAAFQPSSLLCILNAASNALCRIRTGTAC